MFEERGEMAVNWEKEPIGCQFKERGDLVVSSKTDSINLPWLFTQPPSLKKIKGRERE